MNSIYIHLFNVLTKAKSNLVAAGIVININWPLQIPFFKKTFIFETERERERERE